jgi:hypothetical protein
MEYLMRFNGALNPPRFVSDPPGFEMRFDGPDTKFVASDGRSMVFNGFEDAYIISPGGKRVRYKGQVLRFESDDGTLSFWYDGIRYAWVVNEGGTPRYTVTANITGEGIVNGTGFYEAGATVTVSATPAQGWEVSVFTIGGSTIANPHTFTMPSNNVVVFAEFIQTENYLLTEAGDFLLLESGDKIII